MQQIKARYRYRKELSLRYAEEYYHPIWEKTPQSGSGIHPADRVEVRTRYDDMKAPRIHIQCLHEGVSSFCSALSNGQNACTTQRPFALLLTVFVAPQSSNFAKTSSI